MTYRFSEDDRENLLFLLEVGEHPINICERIGFKPETISNQLKKLGMDDAAKPFTLISNQRKKR